MLRNPQRKRRQERKLLKIGSPEAIQILEDRIRREKESLNWLQKFVRYLRKYKTPDEKALILLRFHLVKNRLPGALPKGSPEINWLDWCVKRIQALTKLLLSQI